MEIENIIIDFLKIKLNSLKTFIHQQWDNKPILKEGYQEHM